jgi:hypothetical protein
MKLKSLTVMLMFAVLASLFFSTSLRADGYTCEDQRTDCRLACYAAGNGAWAMAPCMFACNIQYAGCNDTGGYCPTPTYCPLPELTAGDEGTVEKRD